MTAFAIALVLCCAMVCGTVLALRRLARRGEDVASAMERIEVLEGAIVEASRRLVALDAAMRVADTSHAALRAEVESLRAHMALRSL